MVSRLFLFLFVYKMKKLIYAINLVLFVVLSSCEKDTTATSNPLVGNWIRPKYSLKMCFNKDGTYDYYDHNTYKEKLSGRYSYDADKQIWVELRNDSHSYTNYILLLDESTFSYIDNYGNTYIWEREY